LKVAWKKELRRISVPEEHLTLRFLHGKVARMFSLENEIVLKYMDGEELVTLTSDEDCVCALNKAQKRQPIVLRVVVEDVSLEKEDGLLIPVPILCTQGDVTCCICGSVLTIVHYKCLNCLNFELCEQCEETKQHDVHHLLVKLRTPISTFPVKQQLLFHDHIEDETQRKSAKIQKQQLIQEETRAKLMAREHKKLLKEAEKLLKETEKAKKVQEREEMRRLKLVEKEKKKKTNKDRKTVKTLDFETLATNDSLFLLDVPATTPLNDSLFTETSAEQPVPVPIGDDDIMQLISYFQEVNTSLQPLTLEGASGQEVGVPVEDTVQEVNNPEQKEECQEKQPQPLASREEKPHPFKDNLERLREMGFTDESKNIKLLVENRGDLEATVEQLLHARSWLPEFFPLSIRF